MADNQKSNYMHIFETEIWIYYYYQIYIFKKYKGNEQALFANCGNNELFNAVMLFTSLPQQEIFRWISHFPA